MHSVKANVMPYHTVTPQNYHSLFDIIANLQISPDFPAHQKKSGWLYIWVVVVVVVVVVCTRRLGARTNMSATEVE